MLFNSSVYISRHPVRLADKNCDVSVITLYSKGYSQFIDKGITALLPLFLILRQFSPTTNCYNWVSRVGLLIFELQKKDEVPVSGEPWAYHTWHLQARAPEVERVS